MRDDASVRLAARIDALLPQTQCGQCGYDGCRPYAEALAEGDADIDQCPPGGNDGARMLAELLGRAQKPVNPLNGEPRTRLEVALIDEETCIGCTKCIVACPVDAIVGAAQQMHTVIAEHCTGCALCLPPCPIDCIDMVPAPPSAQPWTRPPTPAALAEADASRQRHLARNARLERLAREKAEAQARQKAAAIATANDDDPVARAMAAARARRLSNDAGQRG